MQNFGYDNSLFEGDIPDNFCCSICSLVSKDPLECKGCGSIYCSICIGDWLKRNPTCPNRCKLDLSKLKGATLKLYSKLNIRCQRKGCTAVVSIVEYEEHKGKCKPCCVCFQFCKRQCTQRHQPFCSAQCTIFDFLVKNRDNPKKMYDQLAIGSFSPKDFTWSNTCKSTLIEISDNGKTVSLDEKGYVFRTAISNLKLTSGVHYWELEPSSTTTNQFKVGVCLSNKINYEISFSDKVYGFAFYTNGQLRHNSNTQGAKYGLRILKEGIIGVLLNMNNGTLSFSYNGKSLGVAFTHESLKTGPAWPAISLLHKGKVAARFGMPIPIWAQ